MPQMCLKMHCTCSVARYESYLPRSVVLAKGQSDFTRQLLICHVFCHGQAGIRNCCGFWFREKVRLHVLYQIGAAQTSSS